MSKPCCVVSKHGARALNWPWRSRIGTHKWRRHTSHCDVMNRYHQSDFFLLNQDHVISILNFPVNDFCHDSIGNKLFGFVVSRSDEPIVIGVCGMRLADQDHRIVSEPIASGSFLESGPGVPDKSSRGLGSMSRYSAQILICFIAYIFLIFFLSSVGLVGNFAGLPVCTVPSAIVHCNQNEAGHQTIKAPSMPCWDAAGPSKHSLAFKSQPGENDR